MTDTSLEQKTTRLVGKGTYSHVYYNQGEAYKSTAHTEYVVDQVIPLLSLDYSAVRELFIYAQLQQPYRFFATPKGFYLVQPYIPYTLTRWARKYPRYTATQVHMLMCDVLTDLSRLHEQGILHQDLKPHNIMVDEETRAYVIDFGSAMCLRDSGDDTATEIIQTLSHRAPEELTTAPVSERPVRSGALDIWGLGLIWIEALLGRLNAPLMWRREWSEEQDENLFIPLQYMIRVFLPHLAALLQERNIEPELIVLLQKMISIEPTARPTAQQLLKQPVLQRYRRLTARRCREGLVQSKPLLDLGFTTKGLDTYQRHTQQVIRDYGDVLKHSSLYKMFLALIYLLRYFQDPVVPQDLPILVHLVYLIQEDITLAVTEHTKPLLSVRYEECMPLLRRLVQCRCPLLSPVPWYQNQYTSSNHITAYLHHLALQPTLDPIGLYRHYDPTATLTATVHSTAAATTVTSPSK